MIEKIYYEIEEDFWCESRYLNNIYELIKDKIEGDYSIVITPNLRVLPPTKYKKIVFLTGDELGNLGMNPYPSYDVKAIFRIFNSPNRFDNKFIFPIPPGYNWTMHSDRTKKMKKMYPEKKLSERKWDIFYAGQPLPWRQPLVNNLELLKNKFNIFSTVNRGFRSGIDVDEYYKLLGETKIAVSPDGTAIDTFRYVEAMGSGCIVIMTPKDDLWYYKDAPVFWINNWNELNEDFVNKILSTNIDEIYEKTLEYYKNNLSEEAVANYIIEKLNILK
jgi:hypothetical protein